MLPEFVKVYETAKTLHRELYQQLNEVKVLLPKLTDDKEIADATYALRKAREYLDDVRQQLFGQEELGVKMTCAAYVRNMNGEPIRTPYCIASPDVKTMVPLPKPGTEAYPAFMQELGVPEHLWKTDVVRTYWPGLVEFVNTNLSEGKPLPKYADVSRAYSVFKCTYRGRKEVDS